MKKLLVRQRVTPLPPRPGSGVRRLGDAPARDVWVDGQFRLSADLLHLRMRLRLRLEDDEGAASGVHAAAHTLLARLESLKDAIYEVSADALAPPLAPLLTPASALSRYARALYAWCDDLLASMVARRRGTPPHDEARAALPAMPLVQRIIDELHAVLGAGHPLLARATAHVTESYRLAVAIEEELVSPRE
jgi:hypothetical protein